MCHSDPIDIGQAARRLGVTPATLRLYEQRGVLPKAARASNGYRQYSTEDLRRLRLVTRARRAGMSLRQIAQAMAHDDGAHALSELLRAHLARIERDAERLARLRRHLRRWLERARLNARASPVTSAESATHASRATARTTATAD